MDKTTAKRGVHVPAGRDRHGEEGQKIWGLIPLATKVSSEDSGGSLYLFQHTEMGKGGPPRHVHHEQDEWFFVIQGRFAMEVGDERFELNPGDSFFAPRKVPHAWAHVGEGVGTILTAVTPAGTFEAFIRETARHATLPGPEEIAKAFEENGMTVVGPPLKVD